MSFERSAPTLNDRIYELFGPQYHDVVDTPRGLTKFRSDHAKTMTALEATLEYLSSARKSMDTEVQLAHQAIDAGDNRAWGPLWLATATRWLKQADAVIEELQTFLKITSHSRPQRRNHEA